MKKQTGFISSSSSVSITYSTSYGSWNSSSSSISWSNIQSEFNRTTDVHDGKSWTTSSALTPNQNNTSIISWKTFTNKSYQRIEYFLEAVEKLNAPFEKNTSTFLNLKNYACTVGAKDLYNGFVDIVITFPIEIRLAGLELLNPWINKLSDDASSDYWMFLPSKFNIYKVDDSQVNSALENLTYDNDIARRKTGIGDTDIEVYRPIRYDQIENDQKLILLGKYDVYWKNKPSYKCFFKFNEKDPASLNLKTNYNNAGTATWRCKQLVLRIFRTYKSSSVDDLTIKDKIKTFILSTELKLGTKVNEKDITFADVDLLYGNKLNIEKGKVTSSDNVDIKRFDMWTFQDNSFRNYADVDKLKFESGISYKLGGIQLLLSPDIFSVSEMKMYHYANRINNKVFIGEWNTESNSLEYYGAGTTKTSQYIDISHANSNVIAWRHNFNIPPKYLDVQMFIRFNMDYQSFYVGDVITNLVNINKEPLTLKLTGNEVSVNISNGICFTNPDTGEFMAFIDGVGAQMDAPGNFDAYQAAVAVGAGKNILDYDSRVAAKITGGYPFDIYFVVKRLF